MPGPQRRDVETALLRMEAEGAAPDPHTIGTAVVSLLRRLSAESPVLLALDDSSGSTVRPPGRWFALEVLGELLAQRCLQELLVGDLFVGRLAPDDDAFGQGDLAHKPDRLRAIGIGVPLSEPARMGTAGTVAS